MSYSRTNDKYSLKTMAQIIWKEEEGEISICIQQELIELCVLCCFKNYYQINMSVKNYLLIGGGVLAAVVGGLFIKNILEEKSLKTLTKEQVTRILKIIRKEKYTVYRQIATFAVNIAQQTRNNINPQMIEQFIQGPESPLKLSEQIDRITELCCALVGTNVNIFNHSIEQLKGDKDILFFIEEAEKDYRTSLTGKLPAYRVTVPPTLTKEKFYQIQNQITKKTYLQQVVLFRKLKEHTEIELQQNPSLLKEIGNPEAEQEEILKEEGLGTEIEPPFAVYEAASIRFRNDPDFRAQINKIEQGYQKILMKYAPKLQNKTISDRELNDMEDDIIYFDPQHI